MNMEFGADEEDLQKCEVNHVLHWFSPCWRSADDSIYLDMNRWTKVPEWIQRSLPLSQYSYWAERNFMRKCMLLTRQDWLIPSLSLRNFQQRSMICVPDLTWRTFLVPGSRWRLSSTYLGAIHLNLPAILTRCFLWTTLSWSTPGTRVQ